MNSKNTKAQAINNIIIRSCCFPSMYDEVIDIIQYFDVESESTSPSVIGDHALSNLLDDGHTNIDSNDVEQVENFNKLFDILVEICNVDQLWETDGCIENVINSEVIVNKSKFYKKLSPRMLDHEFTVSFIMDAITETSARCVIDLMRYGLSEQKELIDFRKLHEEINDGLCDGFDLHQVFPLVNQQFADELLHYAFVNCSNPSEDSNNEWIIANIIDFLHKSNVLNLRDSHKEMIIHFGLKRSLETCLKLNLITWSYIRTKHIKLWNRFMKNINQHKIQQIIV